MLVLKTPLSKEKSREELMELALIYLSLRKEVIQPHFPVRLPCYDFTPLTKHTLNTFLPYGLE